MEAEATGAPAAVRGLRRRVVDFLGTLWDELLFIPIDEDNAAAIALEAGEIDFGALGLASVGQFEDNDDFVVHDRVTLNYNWIGMNILNPKLEDINVRQAIRYAIDVPAILEAAYEGRYERATAIIPPGMPIGYWEDAPVYERDLDQANQFLSQAANAPSELDFKFTEETGATEIAEIVQANLAEIGITVTPTSSTARRTTPSTWRSCRAASSSTSASSRSRIPRGRPCGSSATRSTSGTGCTGATRSTTGSTTRR